MERFAFLIDDIRMAYMYKKNIFANIFFKFDKIFRQSLKKYENLQILKYIV